MEYLKANGKVVITKTGQEILLQGVGLGGWLLPEGYMWKLYNDCDRPRKMEQLIRSQCTDEFSKLFWRRYLEEYITEKDIEMLYEWGFNCVRLPINARTLCQKSGQCIEFVPEVIEKIDQLIEWCKTKEIYVILDMHGAPGGQTGKNIDDCENDQPELFMNPDNQRELIELWEKLANRYANEPCVAGYDLLNEPLPECFGEYYGEVLPLYKRLIDAIRNQDQKHLIILEGVHWASDFSIFKDLREEIKDPNIMLQFHKYWNSPDRESIMEYLNRRELLEVPLLMGEGGENNLEWYYGMFQMLRKENISYCFWSYKKMDTRNSLVSFRAPDQWDKMLQAVRKESEISAETALSIWEDFLSGISDIVKNDSVASAIQGKAPIKIPAEYYSGYRIMGERLEGAILRKSEPVTILFKNDMEAKRIPDYKRYGGEEQPEAERLLIQLKQGDMIWYDFASEQKVQDIKISCRFVDNNALFITISSQCGTNITEVPPCEGWKEITCFGDELVDGNVRITIFARGIVDIESITIDDIKPKR